MRKYSLAQRKGKVMIFRRYTNLATATTALTEGVNPSGRAKAKADVAMTIAQFGDFKFSIGVHKLSLINGESLNV